MAFTYTFTDQDYKILDLVSQYEQVNSGGDPYGSLNPGRIVPQMPNQTISYVLNNYSTARGRYQFITGTLRGLVNKYRTQLPPDTTLFSRTVQDFFGLQLAIGRGMNKWKSGSLSDADFLRNLAMEWAALPVPYAIAAGTYGKYPTVNIVAGDSFYTAVSGNKSAKGVPYTTFVAHLKTYREQGPGKSYAIEVGSDSRPYPPKKAVGGGTIISQEEAAAIAATLPPVDPNSGVPTPTTSSFSGTNTAVTTSPGSVPIVSGPPGKDPYLYIPIDIFDSRYDYRSGDKIGISVSGTNTANPSLNQTSSAVASGSSGTSAVTTTTTTASGSSATGTGTVDETAPVTTIPGFNISGSQTGIFGTASFSGESTTTESTSVLVPEGTAPASITVTTNQAVTQAATEENALSLEEYTILSKSSYGMRVRTPQGEYISIKFSDGEGTSSISGWTPSVSGNQLVWTKDGEQPVTTSSEPLTVIPLSQGEPPETVSGDGDSVEPEEIVPPQYPDDPLTTFPTSGEDYVLKTPEDEETFFNPDAAIESNQLRVSAVYGGEDGGQLDSPSLQRGEGETLPSIELEGETLPSIDLNEPEQEKPSQKQVDAIRNYSGPITPEHLSDREKLASWEKNGLVSGGKVVSGTTTADGEPIEKDANLQANIYQKTPFKTIGSFRVGDTVPGTGSDVTTIDPDTFSVTLENGTVIPYEAIADLADREKYIVDKINDMPISEQAKQELITDALSDEAIRNNAVPAYLGNGEAALVYQSEDTTLSWNQANALAETTGGRLPTQEEATAIIQNADKTVAYELPPEFTVGVPSQGVNEYASYVSERYDLSPGEYAAGQYKYYTEDSGTPGFIGLCKDSSCSDFYQGDPNRATTLGGNGRDGPHNLDYGNPSYAPDRTHRAIIIYDTYK